MRGVYAELVHFVKHNLPLTKSIQDAYDMNMFTSDDIKAMRAELDLTMTEFAYRLGVSAATVASWESDRRHPKYAHMEKLNKLKDAAGRKQLVGAK